MENCFIGFSFICDDACMCEVCRHQTFIDREGESESR